MARETSLWDRVKNGARHLRKCDFKTHFCRIENAAGTGNPDVEGCIDGSQIWLELKSCIRPKKPETPIRPKTRRSQKIWHKLRSEAGCKVNFVLIQVGEAHDARLYLIPGSMYDRITAPEAALSVMSVLDSRCTVSEMLLRAVEGY